MKKIFLLCFICLLGINNDLFGQTCDGTDITVTTGVNGSTETQHAQNTLETQSGTSVVIEGNADVTYKAGTRITLNSGFKVEVGSTFKALIEACTIQDTTLFIMEWTTTNTNESITIPTFSGITYDYEVDWSYDGTTFNTESVGVTGDASNIYNNSGTHTVAIRGTFPRIFFLKYVPFRSSNTNPEKITKVTQWGNNIWKSMEGAFPFCSNLRITATDNPNLDIVDSMKLMFYGCTSLDDHSLNDWEVGNVQVMQSLFSNSSYNEPLKDWDVSNVTNMNYMFLDSPFSHSLGNWNVGKVTSMISMLDNCGMSQSNYESTLNGWANLYNPLNQTGLVNDVELGAYGLEYCDDTGREILTDTNGANWTINGDVEATTCSRSTSSHIGKEDLKELSIFPNPATNQIYISGLSKTLDDINIQILDVSGRVVINVKNQDTIDVSSLKSGVYFVQILGAQRLTSKFIKL